MPFLVYDSLLHLKSDKRFNESNSKAFVINERQTMVILYVGISYSIFRIQSLAELAAERLDSYMAEIKHVRNAII